MNRLNDQLTLSSVANKPQGVTNQTQLRKSCSSFPMVLIPSAPKPHRRTWVKAAGPYVKENNKMTYQRLASLLVCAALATGTSALSQTTTAPTNPDIQQDRKDIRQDKRDIKKDRKERNQDLREARKAYKEGDKAEAKEEMKEAKAEQKDINKDKKDLAKDKRDLRHDRRKHHKRATPQG